MSASIPRASPSPPQVKDITFKAKKFTVGPHSHPSGGFYPVRARPLPPRPPAAIACVRLQDIFTSTSL